MQSINFGHKPAGILSALIFLAALGACSNDGAQSTQQAAETTPAPEATTPAAPAPDKPSVAELAGMIQICAIPDPQDPSSAFTVTKSEVTTYDDHWMDNYWVTYQCKETCDDWTQCAVPAFTGNGEPIYHGRQPDTPKQALAFVVDGMGGHMAYSLDGDHNNILFHGGAGGTRFYTELSALMEQRSPARTILVRWEDGFAPNDPNSENSFPWSWGWYSRTSAEATTVPNLNQRVASAISWASENLSGTGGFNTMGCSMGTVATFGAVLWHGLDDIIDYQVLVGGPPMYDVNAGCNMATYTEGFCDLDANVSCSADADCQSVADHATCSFPTQVSIPRFELFQSMANHVHATSACRDGVTEPYAPFDASGMKYATDGDWNIDHSIDLFVDLGGDQVPGQSGGGDTHWGLGHFGPVFQDMTMEAGSEKRWHAIENSHHCDSFENESALDIMVSNLVLE